MSEPKRKIVTAVLFHLAVIAVPAGALTIQNVSTTGPTIGLYEPFFVHFGLSQSYANPFDPAQIDVTFEFTGPSGIMRTIPAFYAADYPGWEARIAPLEPGPHNCRLVARDGNGNTDAYSLTFEAVPSSNPGFIRIDDRDSRYMRFDSGTPYFPVGHNLCWHGRNQPHAQWLDNMGRVGQNWARYWMVPYVGQGIEWGPDVEAAYAGLGRYSKRQAEMFDGMVNNARNNEVYVQMCMDSFNGWNTAIYANWGESPYNIVNGGMLNTPIAYFTNAEAQRYAKQRFRYIIARWAYSTHVLCWEFFNEVDANGAGTPYSFWDYIPQVVEWHRIMSIYIRSIDPFEHLRTTSFANDGGWRNYDPFWELDEMDIVQVHEYNSPTPDAHVKIVRDAERFGKPVILGEGNLPGVPGATAATAGAAPFLGAIAVPPTGSSSKADYSDPTGQSLHDMIWGVAVAQSGAMSWWWDGWIHPNNLYDVFIPLVAYLDGEDFAAHNLGHADVTLFNAPSGFYWVGSSGPSNAFLWLYNKFGSTSNLQVRVNNVLANDYAVQFWDTYTGSITLQQTITAASNSLTFTVPTFARDIAVKVLPYSPIIKVAPDTLTDETYFGENPDSLTFTVYNQGIGSFTYEISSNVAWLQVDPSSGSVSTEADTIEAIHDPFALSSGTHVAEITISSPDAPNSPVVLPVTLLVKPHRADLEGDDDVDQSDFGLFQLCLTRAGVHYGDPACEPCDFNGDGDVDGDDTRSFHSCMAGPGNMPDYPCPTE